jgi:hypothetical protein
MKPILTQLTSLTISTDAIGAGAGVQYDLATLCGLSAAEWAAIPKQSIIIGVMCVYSVGAGVAQIKDAATNTAPSTALDQSTAAKTGVPVGQFEPTLFYADPTKRYLNVYSIGGCEVMVWRAQ